MFFDKIKALFDVPPEAGSSDTDTRRAVAALLIHASRIDGTIDALEIAARDQLLKQKFELADGEIAELVLEAEKSEAGAVDLYGFTRAIKETYDRDQRGHIMEMLWEIILADGVIDDQEAHLAWRVAGLLGFTERENGDFRRKVMQA